MSELNQTIGKLLEAVDTLKTEVTVLRVAVSGLKQEMTSIQSGWKAVAAFSAAIGGAVSIGIIKIAPFIGVFPR